MTDQGKNGHEENFVEQRASKGGKARAKSLAPEARREIARKAAESRWGNFIPNATHVGRIVIAKREITCAVLENGKRVLTQETFLSAIGRSIKPKASSPDGLPPFLSPDNIKPFVSEELRQATAPIVFRISNAGQGRGQNVKRAYGYDAMLLPMVCEVYLNARDAGKTTKQQDHIVKTCDLLIRGFARVGIIALIDEATGYQEERAKAELQKIMDAYVLPELRRYTSKFGEEFFRQIYRLHGWAFKPGNAKRTPFVGKIINKYIYEQLPPGVLEELRKRNPVMESGHRRDKHYQWLTPDIGCPHLEQQITIVTMFMKAATDKQCFEELFERAFAKEHQERLPLIIDMEP